MPKFMYTVQVTEDYIFDAVDREQAENIAGLIRAVDDPELAQEKNDSKTHCVQVDFSESIMEEE